MTGQTKVRGPASCFPSIERRYGKPVNHWLDLLASRGERKHAGRVAWLKTEHGMGMARPSADGLSSRRT